MSQAEPNLTIYHSLLGYAIIQIPDFLASVYAYIEKWIRNRRHLAFSENGNNRSEGSSSPRPHSLPSLAVSENRSNLSESSSSPHPLTKGHIVTGSKIPRQVRNIKNEDISQRQRFSESNAIAELREETNIKIQKLEKLLEDNNRKMENLHALGKR